MGMKRCCWLLVALCCFYEYALAQGEPGRFAISQVTYRSPVLIAYVDVLEQNGEPPAKLVPAQFSARIEQQNLKVASVTSFDQSGEGVAYAFLVDISKSIQPPQFDEMRAEIDDWINGLNADDRMAVFTFGEQERELVDFTSNKPSLIAALQGIAPTDNQTKLYLALRNAIDLGQRTDASLPSRRVIVIVSDGKDEGSGFTADDVGHLVQQSPIPIYAIGFSRLPLPERNTYLEALNRIAVLSGGLYIAGSPSPEAYTAIRQAIRRVFIVQLACGNCRVSSQSQPLELTLRTGTQARTNRLAVSLALLPQDPNSLWQWSLDHISGIVAILVAFVVLIVILILVVMKLGKKTNVPSDTLPPAPPPPGPPPVAPPGPPPVYVQPVAVPPGKKLQLTVLSGNEHGRVDNVSLSARAVVGRDKSCDVSYPNDTEMSAKHFELILAGEHVEVQDLGSTNGTLMNGSRLVAQQRIEDGDWVRAGRTELRINFGA